MNKELKTSLAAEKPVWGIFSASADTAPVEIAGGCGYDFVVLDGEHGQCDERRIFAQLARLEKYQTAGIVRIPAFRPEYVKRYLDYGADGILCPGVESAETARAFAGSLRYPPEGYRGITGIFRASDYNCSFEDYFQNASRCLLAAVQIETVKGVEHVEEISAVPGIDLLFIGHSDLTLDYGCYKNFADPRIIAAEERIIQAARRNNKFAGMVLRPGMDAASYLKRGVNFICLGTDLGILQEALKNKLTAARKSI